MWGVSIGISVLSGTKVLMGYLSRRTNVWLGHKILALKTDGQTDTQTDRRTDRQTDRPNDRQVKSQMILGEA